MYFDFEIDTVTTYVTSKIIFIFFSERKFAVDNGVVSNPVSIVTTSTTETKTEPS